MVKRFIYLQIIGLGELESRLLTNTDEQIVIVFWLGTFSPQVADAEIELCATELVKFNSQVSVREREH